MRSRVVHALLVLVAVVPVGLIVAAPITGAAEPLVPPIPQLVDVQVQDMGSFDRVTFVFKGSVTPDILQAKYVTPPANFNPSGNPVQPPLAGAAQILITMSPAASFDLTVNPPVPSYGGPTRFAPNLPSVVGLIQIEDFEATLVWEIGIRNLGVPATAQAFAGPSRIEVDVPHGGTPAVVGQPAFTG